MAETGEKPIKVLDLFSGIGGFSLGLERAGMQTVAFCEWDKKAAAVLRKHWPSIPVFDDVRTLEGKHVGSVDLICGGFPCQDISVAGKGAGLAGARSGLWWEFHRLIKEIKPRWIIAENVSALRSRGLDEVLRSLAEIGYDGQWHCIPASALGAPHQRDRVWLVAYAQRDGLSRTEITRSIEEAVRKEQARQNHAFNIKGTSCVPAAAGNVADSSSEGLSRGERIRHHIEEALRRWTSTPRPTSESCSISGGTLYSWDAEPNVGRVADGVPGRVDRLKQLGNAVVPQIPEIIGKAIIQWEKQHGR